MWTLFWRALSMSRSTKRKSYFPSSGSIQSHETPVRMVFIWTLPASSGHTTFMRSVSEDTVAQFAAEHEERLAIDDQLRGLATLFQMRNRGNRGVGLCARPPGPGAQKQCAGEEPYFDHVFSTLIGILLYGNSPHVGAARFARGTFHFEDGGVFPCGFVLVHGILFGGRGAVSEVPFPGCDLTFGFVFKGHQAAIHVRNLVRPFRLDGLLELGLQRHEPEAH